MQCTRLILYPVHPPPQSMDKLSSWNQSRVPNGLGTAALGTSPNSLRWGYGPHQGAGAEYSHPRDPLSVKARLQDNDSGLNDFLAC